MTPYAVVRNAPPDDADLLSTEGVRTTAPGNCLLVFIGGEYADRLDDVVDKVKDISKLLISKDVTYYVEKTKRSLKLRNKNVFMVNSRECNVPRKYVSVIDCSI